MSLTLRVRVRVRGRGGPGTEKDRGEEGVEECREGPGQERRSTARRPLESLCLSPRIQGDGAERGRRKEEDLI